MKAVTYAASLLSALLFLSLPACEPTHAKDGESHADHEHEVGKIVVTTPLMKDITVTQRYVCQIHSQRNTEISARAFGILEEIPVREGQAVKAGELLFRIAPKQYQAKLDAEKGKLRRAQLEYAATKRLAEKTVDGKIPVVSQQELLQYEANVTEAEGNVAKAEAELAFATVRAPFDGIIDRLPKQQGSTIKEGELLTTLSDNSVMWVHFNVPEARYLEDVDDLLQSIPTQDPQARAEALLAELNRTTKLELILANGGTFLHRGRLASTGGKFHNETGTTTYRADFPNPDRLLRHGQTGTILVHRTLRDAVLIPQRATFDILDKRFVNVVGDDHRVHQREIVVQTELEDVYVIRKGLKVTDRIILEGTRQVKDGDKIEFELKSAEEALKDLKVPAE